MKKSTKTYFNTLKSMIEHRTGAAFDVFLTPNVEAAAKCWQMIDKIHEELMASDMTSLEVGSMGQQKTIINPLLPVYNQMHRTLLEHFEALGLNFRSTPSKMTENTKRGVDDTDPMVKFYEQSKL
jgi:histidyl-tRNA synthetase